MWLANLMLRETATDDDLQAATRRLVALLEKLATPTIFISNEVGLGIVPESPPDPRGTGTASAGPHQQVARAADLVVLVVAGLPLVLKGS